MIALEIAKRVQRWKWIFSPGSIFLVDFFLREKEQSALNSHLWVIAAFNLLLHSQHHRPTTLSVSLWLSHYCISLYHISYIRQPPTNNIVSVVDINISYNITIATSTFLYDVEYDGEVMKMSDVFKGWILIPQFMQTGHNCLISEKKEKNNVIPSLSNTSTLSKTFS